jgi:hypothetical protein
MMMRSFDDLRPLLRRQYATNKELIESGTAPTWPYHQPGTAPSGAAK